MKKNTLLITILSIFIILPNTILADCQSDFKEIEEYFKAGYKYNKDTDDFTIMIINPNRFKYAIVFNRDDVKTEIEKTVSGSIMTNIINNYKKSEYKFGIQAIYDGCKFVTVKEETIQLKSYNPHADSPLCEGNEDFVLCQKDYDKRISKEEFESRINTYIKSKETTQEIPNTIIDNNANNNNDDNKTNENIFDTILNFIKENIIAVVIIIIFIIVLIVSVVLTIRYEKKRRRLE